MADTGFLRPTLQQLVDRAEADLNARLPGADARLRRSVLGVLSRIISGQTHGLYGYQSWIAKQAIVDTADAENLNAWGAVWGVARKAAVKASGAVVFTGSNGSTVPVGQKIQRGDGVTYSTTAAVTVADGTATLQVKADTAGDAGNADAATQVSFVTPVAGVQAAGAVAGSGLVSGADAETDASYLARVLSRIQSPPHGGAGSDYVRWALEVPGVTRAWVYAQELGRGTVSVRFMMDDTYSGGIPENSDVAVVQAYINERRPVTSEVTVVAPIADPVDITIDNLLPDTADIRAAIAAELADMFQRVAQPGGTIHLSKIWEAVGVASGEESHEVTAPESNHVSSTGYIPALGTITYAADE